MANRSYQVLKAKNKSSENHSFYLFSASLRSGISLSHISCKGKKRAPNMLIRCLVFVNYICIYELPFWLRLKFKTVIYLISIS